MCWSPRLRSCRPLQQHPHALQFEPNLVPLPFRTCSKEGCQASRPNAVGILGSPEDGLDARLLTPWKANCEPTLIASWIQHSIQDHFIYCWLRPGHCTAPRKVATDLRKPSADTPSGSVASSMTTSIFDQSRIEPFHNPLPL